MQRIKRMSHLKLKKVQDKILIVKKIEKVEQKDIPQNTNQKHHKR